MPPRRKQPPAADSSAVKKTAAPITTPSAWKGKVIIALFAVIFLAALWGSGVFKPLFMGPKIPIPREVDGFALGMTLDDVMAKYPLLNLGELFKQNPGMSLDDILKKNPKLKKKLPTMEKALRPFNDDPNFGIATLMPQAGLTGATSVDLLFYLPTRQLYFISANWDKDQANGIPVEDWAHQYRRWTKNVGPASEPLSNDVTLKEWHFDDTHTEMVLRDLKYTDHRQLWQDLRDSSNEPAQSAFAKYRLETGS